jgi:hypothetical protein
MEANNCEKFTRRKVKCRSKHGEKAERCLISELAEKRCLSFIHCPQEAKFYYGADPDAPGDKKAACGAWGEAHCFGNPRLMGADSGDPEKDAIFEHHRKFKYKILNNKRKLEICQKLQSDLNKCLQNAIGGDR